MHLYFRFLGSFWRGVPLYSRFLDNFFRNVTRLQFRPLDNFFRNMMCLYLVFHGNCVLSWILRNVIRS